MAQVYDTLGVGYARKRQPDPRIAAALCAVLDGCRAVLNVGAGTGSYEPDDRTVVAVEPSATMIRQRARGAAPAVQARAEALPFADGSFDAVMGVLTLHHWTDVEQGVAECARVARRRVVFLTVDVDVCARFWLLRDYFPEIEALDRRTMPDLGRLRAVLGPIEVMPLAIPADCRDGFLAAYWRRPEAYLDPAVRASISVFGRIPDTDKRVDSLRNDLATGQWRQRHGDLLARDEIDLGYRIVVAQIDRQQ